MAVSPSTSASALGNCHHLVHGTKWGLLYAITRLVIGVLLIGLGVIAYGMVSYNITFLYEWGMTYPLHLLWAVPVTTLFILIDLVVSAFLVTGVGAASKPLMQKGQEYFDQARQHYSRIRT
ncbi:MAG: hypothetical protein S4CHLAM2_09740 [Chlamydiales bacterium]|nr:hypothetical protein [Chlamydiales bacterium]